MGPAAGDSIKKAKWKKFQSKKSCHIIGQLPDLVVEGDCTLKGILVELFTASSSLHCFNMEQLNETYHGDVF